MAPLKSDRLGTAETLKGMTPWAPSGWKMPDRRNPATFRRLAWRSRNVAWQALWMARVARSGPDTVQASRFAAWEPRDFRRIAW
jgi:hypothetical protein